MQNTGTPVLSATLDRGVISVDVFCSDMRAEDLFAFAQRDNPKRAFLFVSKVLGRHIPVKPSRIRDAFKRLSEKIPDDLEGPVVVIGMAETAVGLGAGVHRHYVDRTGRDDVLYVCSTRYALGSPLLCTFDEEHSHATRHLIHSPTAPHFRRLLEQARSLVLVDDEMSTGRTFANLLAALPRSLTGSIRNTVIVTLTDWSGGAVPAQAPGTTKTVSLLTGRYHWQPTAESPPAPPGPVSTLGVSESVSPHVLAGTDLHPARLGCVDHPLRLSDPFDPQEKGGAKVLVLGTGEHVWQPFLLAEALEERGMDVLFSAITRSPISPGHCISSKLSFFDNYTAHVPNYLYNVDPGAFDKIVLCSETPSSCLSPDLLQALGDKVIVLDNKGLCS